MKKFFLLVLLSIGSRISAEDLAADLHRNLVEKRPDGLLVVRPPEVPDDMNNPWTPEVREAHIQQVNRYLNTADGLSIKGSTYFENEKQWYGNAMFKFLATGSPKALKVLQEQDHQHGEWHRETAGIDYYACFTLKHQIRKYFQFGPGLDPEYRDRMFRGAKAWTEKDPLGRDHYAFDPDRRNQGWGPNARNSWVDVRTTDNLAWMRNAAVYLMAEETGNREVAGIYKDRIRKFVVALYRVGTGEWDSHNYLSHTLAPIHSLYDFAKDPEVRLLAKAALDHYYTAAAIKYRKGNWNGPNKRDYNAVEPMEGSPAIFSIPFGDNPLLEEADYDAIHLVGSAYRVPMAVLALARKQGLAGTELFIHHAPYSAPRLGQDDVDPEYHETQYIGHNFQLGSLARGTREPDANGFKIVADDPDTGAEMLQLVPGPDPTFPGSPQYQKGKLVGRGRVAQFRNLALYLVEGTDTPWTWVVPNTTRVEQAGSVLFLRHADTWAAFHPINVDLQGPDPEKTRKIRQRTQRVKLKKNQLDPPPADVLPDSIEPDDQGRIWGLKATPRHPGYQALSASGTGEGFSGWAVEIGEPQTHGTYADFKSAVIDKAKLDASALEDGRVLYQGSKGNRIEIRANAPLDETPVLRNGEARSFGAPRAKYRNADPGEPAPVHQDWGGGTLRVEAGGHVFTGTVDEDGRVRFDNDTTP